MNVMTLTAQNSGGQATNSSCQQQARITSAVAVERCPLCETSCRNGYYCAACVNAGEFRCSKSFLEANSAEALSWKMKEMQRRLIVLREKREIAANIERSVAPIQEAAQRRSKLEFLRRNCESRKALIAALKVSISKARSRVDDHRAVLSDVEQKRAVHISKLSQLRNHRDLLRDRRDRERLRFESLRNQVDNERRIRAVQLLKLVFNPFNVVPPCPVDQTDVSAPTGTSSEQQANADTAMCFFGGDLFLPLNVSLLDIATSLASRQPTNADARYLACASLARELCLSLARLFDVPACDVPVDLFLPACLRFQFASRSIATSIRSSSKQQSAHNRPLRLAFRAVNRAAQNLAYFAMSYVRACDDRVANPSVAANAKALIELERCLGSPDAVLRNLYVAVQLLIGSSPHSVWQTLHATDSNATLSGANGGSGVEWDLETLDDESSDAESDDESSRMRIFDGPMHRSTMLDYSSPRVAATTRNRSVSVTKIDYVDPGQFREENPSDEALSISKPVEPTQLNVASSKQVDVKDGEMRRQVDDKELEHRNSRPAASDWCVLDEDMRVEGDADFDEDEQEQEAGLFLASGEQPATETETSSKRARAATIGGVGHDSSEAPATPVIQQSMFKSIFNAIIRN